MNPVYEIPPIPPPPVPPPITVEDKDARWRKILWVALAVVFAVPPVWLTVVPVSIKLCGAFRSRWMAAWFAFLFPVPYSLAAAFWLAREGLKRGWHTRTAVLRGWSIAAVAVLALMVFLVMAFLSVRRSSQDKVVLGNARQLSAAADQYFLENGVSIVDIAHLVGATNYVKAVNTVADETYPVFYTRDITITITGVAGARTLTYAP